MIDRFRCGCAVSAPHPVDLLGNKGPKLEATVPALIFNEMEGLGSVASGISA